uniref:Uncharacterized protein n=1 Tax=Lactuca sativa TaxID=4236 RepID=A0A9R1UMN1_LACSA|nr:hypothetical protein LSAT_V11C800451950 [Lactuca sativa]
MVKLIIQGNLAIHTETMYNFYGELQLYESSIDPPTTTAFGGPLALVSTTSQNQIPFNDQNFNHFNQATSFQNQPSSLIRMMKQIINNCVHWLQTQIFRDFSQIMVNQILDQTFKADHILDKIIQGFNQDLHLDKTTQVFNLDLTIDKILKDLPSIITQTKVFKIRDFKTIPIVTPRKPKAETFLGLTPR